VYAPRFAEVRVSTGTNEAVDVAGPMRKEAIAQPSRTEMTTGPKRLAQNQMAELARQRGRASGLKGRVYPGAHEELRRVDGFDNAAHLATKVAQQGPETALSRQAAKQVEERLRLDGIKISQGVVLTGIVEGPGQTIMSWRPDELTGIETPPNRPGLAVVKRVDASEAEPGDTLTFVIMYRNMGNTPIKGVAIVDSLLPRLEYRKGSAKGPKGTAFKAAENRVGSSELRWDLPGVIAPGASGHVSFQAVVR
jgi:uncharacterized repeat protein (TIGR01451 family)